MSSRDRESGCESKTTRRWFNVDRFEEQERRSMEEAIYLLAAWKTSILKWHTFQRENGLQIEDRYSELSHRAATAISALEDVLEFGGTMVESDGPPAPPDLVYDLDEDGNPIGLTLKNVFKG